MKKYLLFILIIPLFGVGQTQIGNDIDAKTEGDLFGQDTALSADGTIIAVASPNNDDNGLGTGLVRVFENNNGSWSQLGQDINAQPQTTAQPDGLSVSLSSNGSVLAVGAAYNDVNGLDDVGQVRIFGYNGSIWTQVGQTIDGTTVLNTFGYDISLSSDGNIIAVSGIFGNGTEDYSGQVKVFENNAGTWTQLGQSLNGLTRNELFGNSISLSSNGSILAVGVPRNINGPFFENGVVKIYENISGSWIQLGQDINGINPLENFGSSVSLSSDGTIVAAGAPNSDLSGPVSGHVRILENVGGTWTQIGQLIPGEAGSDFSGNSVSLSSDGSIVAIGAAANDGNGVDSGHARIFKNDNDNWIQIGTDIDGEAADDRFGTSVSLSSNGDTVAIGAIFNDGVGLNAGHVQVYNINNVLSTESFKQDYFSYYPNPVKDILNINLNDGLKLKRVNVYNIQSQYLYSTPSKTINLSQLNSGIYFIEVETNQGKSAKKIIVE